MLSLVMAGCISSQISQRNTTGDDCCVKTTEQVAKQQAESSNDVKIIDYYYMYDGITNQNM